MSKPAIMKDHTISEEEHRMTISDRYFVFISVKTISYVTEADGCIAAEYMTDQLK